MTTKIFSKPQLQQVLRDLRKAGYTVIKGHGMYKVFVYEESGDAVLEAMPGTRGYLVRYEPQLFTEATA